MHVTRVTQCCRAHCHNSRHLINNRHHGWFYKEMIKLTSCSWLTWENVGLEIHSLSPNTVECSVLKDHHTVSVKCEPLQCQYGVLQLRHDITKLILKIITINKYTTIPIILPTKLGNTEYVWIDFLGNLCNMKTDSNTETNLKTYNLHWMLYSRTSFIKLSASNLMYAYPVMSHIPYIPVEKRNSFLIQSHQQWSGITHTPIWQRHTCKECHKLLQN